MLLLLLFLWWMCVVVLCGAWSIKERSTTFSSLLARVFAQVFALTYILHIDIPVDWSCFEIFTCGCYCRCSVYCIICVVAYLTDCSSSIQVCTFALKATNVHNSPNNAYIYIRIQKDDFFTRVVATRITSIVDAHGIMPYRLFCCVFASDVHQIKRSDGRSVIWLVGRRRRYIRSVQVFHSR